MAEVFVPTLHTFAMENTFSGSCGAFRYMITPKIAKIGAKEVDFPNSTIQCEFWHGPFCYEKSTIEQVKEFPLSEAGRAAMIAWLQENV